MALFLKIKLNNNDNTLATEFNNIKPSQFKKPLNANGLAITAINQAADRFTKISDNIKNQTLSIFTLV